MTATFVLGVLEVTPMPPNGCAKFVERFGADAMKFVNSPVGKELCLRDINAQWYSLAPSILATM